MTTEDQKQQHNQAKILPDPTGTTISVNQDDQSIFKPENHSESVTYWKNRHEKLEEDYRTLQNLNQTLEDRLLNVVESFEAKKKEILERVEYEKSTLMADVNKLSNKLVDARIKLHDYEEKEMLRQADAVTGANIIISQTSVDKHTNSKQTFNEYDPNLI